MKNVLQYLSDETNKLNLDKNGTNGIQIIKALAALYRNARFAIANHHDKNRYNNQKKTETQIVTPEDIEAEMYRETTERS